MAELIPPVKPVVPALGFARIPMFETSFNNVIN